MSKHDDGNTNTVVDMILIHTLDQLHEKQVDWANTKFTASNEGLISLLSDCVSAFYNFRQDAQARKALSHALAKLELEAKDGTHYATRVVRYVFRSKNSRVARYAAIVRSAVEHNISGNDFPAWVLSKGGLDAVRRKANSNANTLSPREASDQIKSVMCEKHPLYIIKNAPNMLKATANSIDTFTAALIHYNSKNNSAEILHGIDNAALTRRFFQVAGKNFINNKMAIK